MSTGLGGVSLERLELLRQETLHGVCSALVIDAAHTAETILAKHGPGSIVSVETEARDQHGNNITVDSSIYLRYTEAEEREWIEIGVKVDGGERLPLFTLRDRVQEGRCSVATLDPTNEDSHQWVRSIIASKDDDSRPFSKNKEGEIVYNSSVVKALNEFLVLAVVGIGTSEDGIALQLESLKASRDSLLSMIGFNDYTRSGLVVDSDNDSYNELSPDRYLRTALLRRLGEMSMGEKVVLLELIDRSAMLSENKIITTYFSKVGEDSGRLDWDIAYGTKAKNLGSASLVPSLSVSSEGMCVADIEDAEVNVDHQALLEGLAASEGFRPVYRLPKPNKEAAIASAYNDYFTDEKKDMPTKDVHIRRISLMHDHFSKFEDFESASQELSNMLFAWSRSPYSLFQNFEMDALNTFRELFVTAKNSLIDIGDINIDVNEPGHGSFFTHIRGITGKIGLETLGFLASVASGAEDCKGLHIKNCRSAFFYSSNLEDCAAENVEEAFRDASGDLRNCKAIKADKAFYTSDTPFGKQAGLIECCEAIDCGDAFFYDAKKTRVSKLLRWKSARTRKLRDGCVDSRIVITKESGRKKIQKIGRTA